MALLQAWSQGEATASGRVQHGSKAVEEMACDLPLASHAIATTISVDGPPSMNNRSVTITTTALAIAALIAAWQLVETDISLPSARSTSGQALTASLLFDDFNRSDISRAGSKVRWLGKLFADGRNDIVRTLAKEFRFLNPTVSLEIEAPEATTGVRSKPAMARHLAAMFRGQRVDWDVIWLDDQIYELVAIELDDPFWGKKHLVDFGRIQDFNAAHKTFITEDNCYRKHTGGILTGPHLEGYAGVLWWNRDVADRIGIKVKHHRMTFDDLLGYVRAVHRYNQTASHPIAAFYEASDWTTLEILFQNLVKSELGDFECARSNTGSRSKREALQKTLKAFERLGAYRPLIPSHGENLWFDTREIPLHGETLFSISGTWMHSQWSRIDPQRTKAMQPAELPTFKPVSYTIGSYTSVWAVPKRAPSRDAAVELMLSFCRSKVAERWVRESKNPTGLRGDLTMSTGEGDALSRFQQAISQRYGSRLHYSATTGYLLGTDNAHLHSLLCEQLRAILCERTTAEAAYETLIGECR